MYITVNSNKVELRAANHAPMVTNNYRDRHDARDAAMSLRKTLLSIKDNPALVNKRIIVREVTPGKYAFQINSRNGGKLASSVRMYTSTRAVKNAIRNCINQSNNMRITEV